MRSNGSLEVQTGLDLPGNFDNRFLEVCQDGDVEDLVQLFEEMARIGEPISQEMLNTPDGSGRVRTSFIIKNGFSFENLFPQNYITSPLSPPPPSPSPSPRCQEVKNQIEGLVKSGSVRSCKGKQFKLKIWPHPYFFVHF
jgi:hypothetical protein